MKQNQGNSSKTKEKQGKPKEKNKQNKRKTSKTNEQAQQTSKQNQRKTAEIKATGIPTRIPAESPLEK